MIVKNTKATRSVQQTAASLAIEGMYADDEFIKKMIEVAEGKRTAEELIAEVIVEYKRPEQ